MKLLFLLLILVSTVVFLIQNQQPIDLYFLGVNTQTALFTLKLPIGIGVILFSIAGILTSLIIQFLNQFSASSSSRTFTPPSPRREPPKPPSQPPEPSEFSSSSKEADWGKMPQKNWEGIEQEIEEEDGWDIEKPPTEPTFTREKLERELQEGEEQTTDFEVQQPPKKTAHEGSVYSYTYRELRESEDSPPFQESVKPPPKKPETPRSKNQTVDQVYDANYRILTPPYPNDQESSSLDQEEDQDWI